MLRNPSSVYDASGVARWTPSMGAGNQLLSGNMSARLSIKNVIKLMNYGSVRCERSLKLTNGRFQKTISLVKTKASRSSR